MTTIAQLLHNREVYHIETHETVLDAVRWMVERNIGAVAVLRNGELAGIFSERDLMKRVVAEGRDPRTTRVEEIMTHNPTVVAPGESVEHCMLLMKQKNFRHLPVCDGQRLKGMVSLRDILLHEISEKDGEVQMMRAYIQTTPGM
jgi:CBS domain-containing protein